MPRVKVRDNEPLEIALKRFKKKLQREGTLREYRNRKYYEKPSEKKRRKAKEAKKNKARSRKYNR